ncbi:hypothetical protein CPT_Shady_047 [Streptomyces phage Shady]|uniref:Uncharacterized protein n=1 Tax=Streptomyces phage Shady TaxID=2767585 RepID=A0A873WI16_9CAUD|nr:hypothetical protein CPT_Shady_047 [Streptomyces phage Shady]
MADVFVTLWVGDQNLTMDGEIGFNRLTLDAEDIPLAGFDAVHAATKLAAPVDRVTVEWDGGKEVWSRNNALRAWMMD